MPMLHVLSGPDLGRAYRVQSGALIGRSAECAVALSAASISRRHARLEQHGERWRVVDLESRNGIAAAAEAGARVAELELIDGDEFVVGDVRLRWRLEGAVPVELAAAPPTPRGPAAAEVVPAHGAAHSAASASAAGALDEIVLEPLEAPRPHRASAAELRGRELSSPGAMPPDAERTALLRRDAQAASGGWLTGDLEQWPLPLRIGAGLAAIALCAGLAYACFVLVQQLRA